MVEGLHFAANCEKKGNCRSNEVNVCKKRSGNTNKLFKRVLLAVNGESEIDFVTKTDLLHLAE